MFDFRLGFSQFASQMLGHPSSPYKSPFEIAFGTPISPLGYNPQTMGSPYSPQGFGSPFSLQSIGSPYSPQGVGSPFSPQGFGSPYSPQAMGSPYSPQSIGSPYSPQAMGSLYSPQSIDSPLSSPLPFIPPKPEMRLSAGEAGNDRSYISFWNKQALERYSELSDMSEWLNKQAPYTYPSKQHAELALKYPDDYAKNKEWDLPQYMVEETLRREQERSELEFENPDMLGAGQIDYSSYGEATSNADSAGIAGAAATGSPAASTDGGESAANQSLQQNNSGPDAGSAGIVGAAATDPSVTPTDGGESVANQSSLQNDSGVQQSDTQQSPASSTGSPQRFAYPDVAPLPEASPWEVEQDRQMAAGAERELREFEKDFTCQPPTVVPDAQQRFNQHFGSGQTAGDAVHASRGGSTPSVGGFRSAFDQAASSQARVGASGAGAQLVNEGGSGLRP